MQTREHDSAYHNGLLACRPSGPSYPGHVVDLLAYPLSCTNTISISLWSYPIVHPWINARGGRKLRKKASCVYSWAKKVRKEFNKSMHEAQERL